MKNSKGIISYVIVAVLILAAVSLGWFLRGQSMPESEEDQPAFQPEEKLAAIGEEEARELLSCVAGGEAGRYRSCSIEIKQPTTDGQVIIAIHEGLFDDSVSAGRTEANVVFVNGVFVVIEKTQTHRCARGPNTEDFGSEMCP